MAIFSETIAAIATPTGQGGIGVVRISGPRVRDIIQEMLAIELTPRVAKLTPFLGLQGECLDEGIALFFPAPHSFTGEDVLELQGHGGPIVLDMLLKRIVDLPGVRVAKPGEFSERAFLNGKLDLTQAEAISDLIHAASEQAAKGALRSLQGAFSKEIRTLNEKIIQLRMYVEAAIDFTDEDIDFLSDDATTQKLTDLNGQLERVQAQARAGSLLREGFTVVIVGAPNVGKSSLMNRLSGKDIAIVTDIPGTTRDIIRDYVALDGIPMHLLDTAGLRESSDVIEQEGIRRAQVEMGQADLILYMLDCREKLSSIQPTTNQPHLFIRNKIDLLGESAKVEMLAKHALISLSVKTGAGIALLIEEIKKFLGLEVQAEGVFIARRRHLAALACAKEHLVTAGDVLKTTQAGELLAEELRLAQLALNEITGEFTTEDLLGRIFSQFCVGK